MSDFTSPAVGGRGAGKAGELSHAGSTGGAIEGLPIPDNPDLPVTHRLRVDRSRSMKSITDEVETLLDGLEDGARRSGASVLGEEAGGVQRLGPGDGRRLLAPSP